MSQTHKVKIWPQFFAPVKYGTKTFEYRDNDRGYQKGDVVILQEYDPTLNAETNQPIGYTERELQFTIGYVLPTNVGNTVVLSILDLKEL